ncbi:hypothetical protein TD95_004013 [Thielaviopsis punctulata]|uniref:FAD-binding domain-containing protein n=1 Tax=Thielaviopsis punctulata TaxID=72032 RepID=A0A0F4Z6A7_9PEZI|nr:hypothetical protein TD95_004013 [Thielaviopsis punctulata]
MSDLYDIVIVGAGPVGLTLSTCLARWGYRIKHIDNRPHPTETGRADGIQPRSLDLLRNMGLKPAIMAHDPALVYEVAFWDPPTVAPASASPSDPAASPGIVRTGTWASCPDFIDARFPFTTLLHQGHIERVFLHDMQKHKTVVQRPWIAESFAVDKTSEYPVTVHLRHVDGGQHETVRAKYLFGGEGARSPIRQTLGIAVRHLDPISYVWGVMDGVVRTDFPDIKMKCTIHSAHGSIMVIPREDNMVRLYIQLASSADPDFDPRRSATAEEVQASAKKIMAPYKIEWERLEWYSVYPIGQGLADRYTLDERVFLGGDACHTHSPKAGQGMNTAFHDALNLAWKIHLVEGGFASRALLSTYESERRGVAQALLDFDNRYAKLFSQKPSASTVAAATSTSGGETDPGMLPSPPEMDGEAPKNAFVTTFKESCEFTSGYGVAYTANALNWSPAHPVQSPLIIPNTAKIRTGRLFPNANVTRVVDANAVHLEQQVPLNGAFRLFIFAGAPSSRAAQDALHAFGRRLEQPTSFLQRHAHATRTDDASEMLSYRDMDTPHSRFFTLCTVLAAERAQVDILKHTPAVLARYRDHVYADDGGRVPVAGERVGSGHAKMGLEDGAVVVVRPDGYVSVAVRLVGEETAEVLDAYFKEISV